MSTCSAQHALRTRLCMALDCENDAQFSHPLCSACQRKLRRHGTQSVRIVLPVQPVVVDTATHLWCFSCETWKADDDFSRRTAATTRRCRNPECKECASNRRRRDRLDPAVKARERVAGKLYRARRAARESETNQ